VGESAFAAHLRYGSYVLGDQAFRSAEDEKIGKARYLRMLYGGYRWAGVAGFFPWDNLHGYEDADKVFSDLYVVPRRQTDRLYAGRENRLLFKVMNDTFSKEPVTLEWSYTIGDEKIAGRAEELRIEPGFGREVTLSIRAPQTDVRLDGTLTLKASQPGAPDYVDERPVPVLPVVEELKVQAPVTLLDRSGAVADFLRQAGLEFSSIGELAEARGKEGVLLIGPDTLTAEEALGRDLLTFAGRGGRVIVLEQDIPAAGANLPAPVRTTTHYGGYAHPKALGTAVFKDLGKEDLIDWAGGHPVYKNVYEKPTQGARSLAECGPMLPYAPLIEMPAGDGVIVLCQLRVGANLGKDAAADVLLRNLLQHYAGYRPATGVAAIYAPGNKLLAAKINETGSLNQAVGSVAEALDAARFRVAVIEGTKANLAALNAAAQKAQAFQDAGGWIMIAGLKPDAIGEYNRLVGVDHMIRPFRLERVTLESPEFPLAATLGNRELALYSATHLQHSRYWISRNEYSYVIDGLDAAPFTQPPGAPEDIMVYEPTHDDHDPYNFVNGMLHSDHWRYIRQIWVPEEGAEPLVFTFRRPETIAAVRIWNNNTYWTIEDLDVIIDGNQARAYHMTLPDSDAMTELKFPEPVHVEKSITLQIRSWRVHRNPEQRLVGIDNVQFLRPGTPGNSVFIDNVGGLVAYPGGKGGIFLNQIKFMDEEPNPENAAKKLNVMGVILQNMGIGARSASVALPGVNLRFTPVEMTDNCTQFLKDRQGRIGWFGQKGRDMANLLVGEQTMADVRYHLVDYATAPVPDCIVLGAQGAPEGMPEKVSGIKVGRKADVLFFLHTANVRRPITERERSSGNFQPPEVLRYVIHYADGETAQIPVLLGVHIDHWLQAEPKPLEGALVGTTVAVPGVDGQKGVLYSMQARNPRPDAEIATIDVALGAATNRAVPAVLAITLGEIIK